MSIFFKSTEDLKKSYTEIAKNTDFEILKTPLRQVAQIYIEPYLGGLLTAELADEATGATEPTGIKKDAITSLKDAIAHYLIFQELPTKTFIIGNSGARQATGDQSTPLSIANIKFIQAQEIRKADAFLNRALKLIVQNPDDFQNFKPEINTRSVFFKSAEVLENHINIKGFKAFALMSKFLIRAEDEIFKILGNQFILEIPNSTDFKVLVLFSLIRHFVANKALCLALPHLNFIIDGDGLKILSSTDAEDKRSHVTAQNKKLLDDLKTQCEKDADHYKKELLTHLFKNADSFPIWKLSDYYIQNSTQPITQSTIITSETGAIGFFRK